MLLEVRLGRFWGDWWFLILNLPQGVGNVLQHVSDCLPPPSSLVTTDLLVLLLFSLGSRLGSSGNLLLLFLYRYISCLILDRW